MQDSSTKNNATSDAGGTVKYRYYSTLAACNDAANTSASPGGSCSDDTTTTEIDALSLHDALPISAGTFYWRAWYSGDSNNSGASSACADEALVVGKASPTIATLLSDDSITVGGTMHDSSTLSGATSDAGGTVKYRYYSTLAACNDAANTYASPGGTSAGDKTVTAVFDPTSADATFTPALPDALPIWYSGDSNNSGASSACADEALVVGKASPTIATLLS